MGAGVGESGGDARNSGMGVPEQSIRGYVIDVGLMLFIAIASVRQTGREQNSFDLPA